MSPLDGKRDVIELLEVDEPLDVAGPRVPSDQTLAVFVNTTNKLVGDADIGSSPTHVGKNVDMAAHCGILKYGARE